MEKAIKANTILKGTILAVTLLAGCSQLALAANHDVLMEFFYFPSGCPTCDRAKPLIMEIEKQYKEKIHIDWIDVSQTEGLQRFLQYNFSRVPAVVVNHEYAIPCNDIAQEKLRSVIEAYLQEASPAPVSSAPLSLMAAFSMGLFETLSPCLIAILSFILSYTAGKISHFKEGLSRVIVFGFGFVSAANLLGATLALAFISFLGFQSVLMCGVCIFAIVFGLNLLGVFKMPIETKPIVKSLVENHAFTYAGLFSLGFLFYFLDPCIAPFLFTALVMLQSTEPALLILMFGLGAMIPFIFIGVIAGSASKLARKTYKQRKKIRAISGLILIGYAIYLITIHLIPAL